MKEREGRKVEGRGGGIEGKGSVPPLLFNNLTTYSNNNNAKYTEIMGRYDFEATAIESLGGFSLSARQLITNLGRRISQNSGDERVRFCFTGFRFWCVQRSNVVLLHARVSAPD